MPARDQRDRLEIALDVVGQLRHHVAGDGERADRPHADGVAVGRRLRDQVEPERERAARAVVDDDRLAQLLAELGARMRATLSVALPAACGTMKRIG